jgi:acyl-ACP thioesterase
MADVFYEHQQTIDSRDVDGQGYCRPSALLGHLQEIATQAAEAGGFGRERMVREEGAFWMLVRMWFQLKRPLRWNEAITVRTWHRGGKSALMYRDFDLFVDGEAVGQAVSAWVLADLDSRHLRKLSCVPSLDGTDGGSLCKTINLSKLRLPQEMTRAERRRMRYSDTDINGHVNNTRYADFVCDVLELERRQAGEFCAEMQLDYTAECRAGEELILLTGQTGETHFVTGMDEDEKKRFEASLNFGKVLP